MIDRSHRLSITRQAQLMCISRGTVYYRRRPPCCAQVQLMHSLDTLHMAHPFAGSRMLKGLLQRQGHCVGRRHLRTLMKRMCIAPLYCKPRTSIRHPQHKIYPYLLRNKTVTHANQVWAMDITYVRMANGSFGCTAFADGVYARRIVGWACAMTMNTQELPLQALGQAISWAASRGGADGLIRHGDHGTQCTGTVYTTGVMEYGMLPSTGTVGDSYDNAMAESADGAYKTELVWRRKPFADLKDLELATFRWVSWWNSKRLHRSLGYRTPEAVETEYHQHQAAQAAPL